MKLNYSIRQVASFCEGQIIGSLKDVVLNVIHYDTRLFEDGERSLFLCLTAKRKGSDFINEAYHKGCRVFLVPEDAERPNLHEITFIVVKDVLQGLQLLATKHRQRFSYPVIAITGSFGKTIVKEWLNHFLKEKYNVVRSPKSFNSQLGVALSVLQMQEDHEIAIFEAGISQPNEMERLEQIIRPTLGIFTGLGSAHDNGFLNRQQKLEEKSKLFKGCPNVVSESYSFSPATNRNWNNMLKIKDGNSVKIHVPNWGVFEAPFSESHKIQNLCAVLETLKTLDFPPEFIAKKITSLPQVAMRMEVIQGKNNNIFVNDSYAMDGLAEALSFLLELSSNKSKLVFIGMNLIDEFHAKQLCRIREEYPDLQMFFVSEEKSRIETINFSAAEDLIKNAKNTAVLLKGQHGSGIAKLIVPHIARSHPTILEISRQALRNNLTQFKKCLEPKTKLMVMVKASAYGVGADEMAAFLSREGIDYLGVAFPDEGVNLRKSGVLLPIMVMNSHDDSFNDLIHYQLEPSIFSLEQLDAFTTELIRLGIPKYGIHLKIETGMNRLGFREEDLPDLINFLSSQPEIEVKSVYSHLAESGNSDKTYTRLQLNRFEKCVEQIQTVIPGKFLKHICNTDGIINFPEAHFDMVRLGIGLFGYAQLAGLEHAVSIRSKISKINQIK
jgi:alanine racemase